MTETKQKKWYRSQAILWLCAAVYLSPVLALAQTPAPVNVASPVATPTPIPEGDVEGAFGVVSDLIKAVTDGNWTLVASLALMLIVFVVRNYLWKQITKEWIPIATVLLGAGTYVSGALATGVSPLQSILQGLAAGVAAVGLWEVWKAGKRLIKGEPKEPANG